jgi:lambda family phage minor tail protein L
MAKGINQNTVSEALSLGPSAIIEFYLLYYNWPTDQTNVLAITPSRKEIGGTIVWQGQSFIPWALETSGFGAKGDNSLPRPRIKLNNFDLSVSKYLKTYNNLIGVKVVRKRTFVKFLDDTNFTNGKNPYYDLATNTTLADESSHLPDQTFYVNRRVTETRDTVELELSTVFELDNVFLPNRNVYSRYCTWVYRGHGCRYKGEPKTTANSQQFKDSSGSAVPVTSNLGKWEAGLGSITLGQYVFVETDNYVLRSDTETNLNAPSERLKTYYVCVEAHTASNENFPPISDKWQRDDCAKKISDCKLRFGSNLRFGGFPGTHAYPPKG